MPALAPARSTPANDVIPEEIASHPPRCTCAVHLAWRQKKVGAG
jgi:5-methyltetrahydrofolate--homocysteine methyltransferase